MAFSFRTFTDSVASLGEAGLAVATLGQAGSISSDIGGDIFNVATLGLGGSFSEGRRFRDQLSFQNPFTQQAEEAERARREQEGNRARKDFITAQAQAQRLALLAGSRRFGETSGRQGQPAVGFAGSPQGTLGESIEANRPSALSNIFDPQPGSGTSGTF